MVISDALKLREAIWFTYKPLLYGNKDLTTVERGQQFVEYDPNRRCNERVRVYRPFR